MIFLGNQAVGAITHTELQGNQQFNDVNFYDCDGRIAYSYTKEQFLALESMPMNLARDGLISQGWNWTLSDAKAYVTANGECDIGQMYTTTDGKTRVFINIPWEDGKLFKVYWMQTVANGVTIDWGDGSATETFSGTGSKNTTHNYTASGDYVISFDVATGCEFGLGLTNNGPFTGYGNTDYINGTCVKAIQVGARYPKMYARAFASTNFRFEYITVPSTCTDWSDNSLFDGTNIQHVTVPSGVTSIGTSFVNKAYMLETVSLPKSLIALGSYAFTDCRLLKRILLQDGMTILSQNFCNASLISKIKVPNTVTSIGGSAFANCYGLKSITIPENVTTIGASAFNTARGTLTYYFFPISPPALENSNAFTNILPEAVIYVPYSADHSILNAYQTAANWTTVASKMQEMSAL